MVNTKGTKKQRKRGTNTMITNYTIKTQQKH